MTTTANPLLDARRKRSEELAFEGERTWKDGARDVARQLFGEAATIEEEVARSAPPTLPKARGVLAISAASLWYKAGELERAKRVAYAFLAAEAGLSDPARTELEQLVERCSREAVLSKLTNDPTMVPVEMRLQGGRVGVGVAPEGVARRRRETLSSLLIRTAELEAGHDYRERSESELSRTDQIQLLEVPAIAASYGVRFYVATGTQQALVPQAPEVTPARVVERFLALASMAAENPEALRAALPDPLYANAFLEGFAEIAPDGEGVGTVACSAPSWKVAARATVFEVSHRRDLRAAVEHGPLREAKKGERIVEGAFAELRLTRHDAWAEVEEGGKTERTIIAISDKRLRQRAASIRASNAEVRVRVYAKPGRAQRLMMTDIVPIGRSRL